MKKLKTSINWCWIERLDKCLKYCELDEEKISKASCWTTIVEARWLESHGWLMKKWIASLVVAWSDYHTYVVEVDFCWRSSVCLWCRVARTNLLEVTGYCVESTSLLRNGWGWSHLKLLKICDLKKHFKHWRNLELRRLLPKWRRNWMFKILKGGRNCMSSSE